MRRRRLQINTMSNLTDKKIAVLMGGPGSERAVSLATGAGVAKALRSLSAKITEVDVGSSRVDLQACKLEYSIVSPK